MSNRQVVLHFEVFEEICKYSSQYASFRKPKERWVECLGYLFCDVTKPEHTEYHVRSAVGISSGSEMRVEMTPDELAKIEQYENERPGQFLGGWWHTHPGLSLFYSDTDVDNQIFYQQGNPDGLGLVFDLSLIDEDFIGFKIFRLKSKNSREYVEVPYKLEGFSKDGLKRAFNHLGGIPDYILHNLCVNLGIISEEKIQPIDYINSNDDIKQIINNLDETTSDDNQAQEYLSKAEILFKKSKVSQIKKDFKQAFIDMMQSAVLYFEGNEEEFGIESIIDAVDYGIKADSTISSKAAINYGLEILEDEEDIEDKDFFKSKLFYSLARIYELEGNYAIAADYLKNCKDLLDPEEDFNELYQCLMRRGNLLMDMKDYTLAKNEILDAIRYAKLAIEQIDESDEDFEDDKEKITGDIAKMNSSLDELSSKTKNQGLKRIV